TDDEADIGHAPVLQEDLRSRTLLEQLALGLDAAAQARVERKAFARETNRRLQARLQRQAPVALGNVREARGLAGNAGGERGLRGTFAYDVTLLVEEHVARRRERRDL